MAKDKTPIPDLTLTKAREAIEQAKTEITALIDDYIGKIALVEDIDLDGLKTELNATVESISEELENETIDLSDADAEDVLAKLDSDDIFCYVTERNPDILQVRVSSASLADKLRQFLETEIYPFYIDQVSNILF